MTSSVVDTEAADGGAALDTVETESLIGVVETRHGARPTHGRQPRLAARRRRYEALSRVPGRTRRSVASGLGTPLAQERQTLVAKSSRRSPVVFRSVLRTPLAGDRDLSGVAVPVHDRFQTPIPRQRSGYYGHGRVLDRGGAPTARTDDLGRTVVAAAASAILAAGGGQVSDARGLGVGAEEAAWAAAGGSGRRGRSSCAGECRTDHTRIGLAPHARTIRVRLRSAGTRTGVLARGWTGPGDRQGVGSWLIRGGLHAEDRRTVFGERNGALETDGMRTGQQYCVDVQSTTLRTTQLLFHARLEFHCHSAKHTTCLTVSNLHS